MASLITYAIAAVVLIWLFTTSDIYAALCPVFNCHSLKYKYLIPLLIIAFCAGTTLSHTSAPANPAIDAEWFETVIVLSAVAISVTAGRAISNFRPAAMAIVGAYAGFEALKTGDVTGISTIPLTWLYSFAAAVILGWLFCSVFKSIISRSHKHYLLQMWIIGIICTITTLVMVFVIGFNSGCIPGIPAGWSIPLFALAAAAAIPFMPEKIFRLNERYFSINPDSTLAIICAVIISLLIFSFGENCSFLGCTATLLSPGLLTFGAFIGCGFAKRQESISTNGLFRLAGNSIIVPVLAFSLSYLFNLSINADLVPERRGITTGVFLMLGITAVIVMTVLALRLYNSVRFSGKAMDEQAELLNENRRAVNDMEIRTMQVENEYLRNQLELKQKELVSIAMNITEQKEFIQKLSGMATSAAKQNNPELKDEAIRQICSELDLRLNFDTEIDSFYTRVEQLHKDFTIRLSEKFPDLTKQERRLTTLLRLGFSSKYIASLMNITPKSVEICRHRLRSKLGLTRDQNLSAFVKSI